MEVHLVALHALSIFLRLPSKYTMCLHRLKERLVDPGRQYTVYAVSGSRILSWTSFGEERRRRNVHKRPTIDKNCFNLDFMGEV